MHYFIQLLADNHLELAETLQNEVEANPMLEIETAEKTGAARPRPTTIQKRIERADTSFMTPYEEHGFLRKNPDDIDKNKALEILTPSNVSLADHLLEQAAATFDSDSEIEIARQIIYNLDGDGYLKTEIESIASLIGTTPDRDRARAPADHPLRPPRLRQQVAARMPAGPGRRRPGGRDAAPADPRPPRGPLALQLRGHRPAPGHRHATRCCGWPPA